MICTNCHGAGSVNIDDGNISLGTIPCHDCQPEHYTSTPEQRWEYMRKTWHATFAALAESEKADRDD